VDVQFASPDPEARPIRATVVVFKHGDRFIAFDDATTIGLLPGDGVTPLFQARTVPLDTYALAPTIAALGSDANQVLIVADVEGEVESASLNQVQHLVVPMAFARRLAGETDPAAILSALWNDRRATVVVTDGADGVWFRDAASADCHISRASRSLSSTPPVAEMSFTARMRSRWLAGWTPPSACGSRQLQELSAQPAAAAAGGYRPRAT
jgi:sugar/nucleoside kinase (ribokinase family)